LNQNINCSWIAAKTVRFGTVKIGQLACGTKKRTGPKGGKKKKVTGQGLARDPHSVAALRGNWWDLEFPQQEALPRRCGLSSRGNADSNSQNAATDKWGSRARPGRYIFPPSSRRFCFATPQWPKFFDVFQGAPVGAISFRIVDSKSLRGAEAFALDSLISF